MRDCAKSWPSARADRLILAALAAGALVAACAVPVRQTGVDLNDEHSRLNPTHVHEVVQPRSPAEIARLVQRASRQALPISISGGRHAMGGQQFAGGALHLDMSRMNRVLDLDMERGIVTVQAGVRWPELIDRLIEMQPAVPQPWSIVQKQTGADALTIGGALSANVHGRGLTLRPFVQDVESFRLVQADGREIEVSRSQNAELFRLATGGYGLFGVITSVDLRLQRRMKLRRDVVVADLEQVPALFAERIRDGYLYGDFQFKTDERAPDFLEVGVFSAYRPVALDTPLREELRLAPDKWRHLFALAHLDKARAFEAYRDYYLGTHGQIYWSDTHQLSYYDPDFEGELKRAAPGYPPGSLMITEVYVPVGELVVFMETIAQDFRNQGTNLVYGTIRHIRRDTETFLPWARQDFVSVVMNLRVEHSESGLSKAQAEFQRIIDRALERGGSYFLTYHRWARKDQVLRAYPEFVEFLKLKRQYDPDERFQSDWYRHYTAMFAEDLVKP